MSEYLNYRLGPKEALRPRESFVCVSGEAVVGFVAGHLTRRFNCDGELQWILVRPECRRRGVASKLFLQMAKWFVANNAHRICVGVDPDDNVARRFYAYHGAKELQPHWMIWKDIRDTHRRMARTA
jgi:GNAT superfamily N-acetyltransferase